MRLSLETVLEVVVLLFYKWWRTNTAKQIPIFTRESQIDLIIGHTHDDDEWKKLNNDLSIFCIFWIKSWISLYERQV